MAGDMLVNGVVGAMDEVLRGQLDRDELNAVGGFTEDEEPRAKRQATAIHGVVDKASQ